MFKYLGLGAGLAVAVSLGYGIYAGVRSHLNLQIAYEAAQAQLSLNADLQAEVDRYAAQVAAIDRKYEGRPLKRSFHFCLPRDRKSVV